MFRNTQVWIAENIPLKKEIIERNLVSKSGTVFTKKNHYQQIAKSIKLF